mgnify:CR=1 FL=1
MDQAIFISSGDNWTVDNYGTIYGEDAKAINIKKGDNNFDLVIATPASMRIVGQHGQILGPKGLMPNPKVLATTE